MSAPTLAEDTTTGMTCPAWCNRHTATAYGDDLPAEHTHRGAHRLALGGSIIEVELVQLATITAADGVTVVPVEDEPHLTVSVVAEDGKTTDYQGLLGELTAISTAIGTVTLSRTATAPVGNAARGAGAWVHASEQAQGLSLLAGSVTR